MKYFRWKWPRPLCVQENNMDTSIGYLVCQLNVLHIPLAKQLSHLNHVERAIDTFIKSLQSVYFFVQWIFF